MSDRSLDLKAMRQVRGILVKHWIDLGRVSLRCTAGALHIRGILLRLGGVQDPLSPPIVQSMFDEIKRIRDIKRIQADLDNWDNFTGSWRPKGSSVDTSGSAGPDTSAGGSGATINIKGE